MDSEQRRALLLLIAMGGSTVLASYVLAFVLEPEIRTGLWGGIQDEGMRVFYTVNMCIADRLLTQESSNSRISAILDSVNRIEVDKQSHRKSEE